jgi:hypothetical protein
MQRPVRIQHIKTAVTNLNGKSHIVGLNIDARAIYTRILGIQDVEFRKELAYGNVY